MEALSFVPKIEQTQKDRSEIKEKLSKFESLYHQQAHKIFQLFECSQECVFICDVDGNILEVNKYFVLTFGYSNKEDVIGFNMMNLFSLATHHQILGDLVELFEHGLVPYRKRVFVKSNFTKFILPIRFLLLTDQFNSTIGILGVVRQEQITHSIFDNTEINIDELNSAFNNFPSIALIVDNQLNILNINDTGLQLAEQIKENVIGLKPGNIFRCISSFNSPNGCGYGEKCKSCKLRQTILDTLRNGKNNTKIESPILLEINGEIQELNVVVSTVFLNNSKEPSVLVIIDDITEKKKIELELYRKEKELETSNKILKKLNEKLIKSYASVQKYNQQLKDAKESIEEYDKLKTAFLSNISHEIRTPLNGIVGFSELLVKSDLTDFQKDEYKAIVKESTNRLINILDDLIEVSQVESGNIEINTSSFNINSLLEEVYITCLPEVEPKGLILRLNSLLPDDKIKIKSDREKLSRILYHLVGNAKKFTNEGYIELGANLNGNSIVFYVKDTGKGIPGKIKDVIFERFRKGEDEHSRFESGIGIGLSLSKAYIELLGGKIWLDSQENKGSTFHFSLPVNDNTFEPVETENDYFEIDYSDTLWAEKTILIVEDEEFNYIYLKEILKSTNAYLIHAKTAKLAIEICKAIKSIDLILLDIKLPDQSGYVVSTWIKENNINTTVIAQTAFAADTDKEEALKKGCDNYISKPIEPNNLLHMLKEYLNK